MKTMVANPAQALGASDAGPVWHAGSHLLAVGSAGAGSCGGRGGDRAGRDRPIREAIG